MRDEMEFWANQMTREPKGKEASPAKFGLNWKNNRVTGREDIRTLLG